MTARPRALSEDTPLEVERAWLDGLRAKGPAWRLERMFEWSAEVRAMALAAFTRIHPDATPREQRLWMLRECYGEDIAERYAALRPEGADAPVR